ncbi:MAG TPA: hypothetical protein VF545_02000 [Thermoleophilaceae bacterium]|jgi:hypothetical protein
MAVWATVQIELGWPGVPQAIETFARARRLLPTVFDPAAGEAIARPAAAARAQPAASLGTMEWNRLLSIW